MALTICSVDALPRIGGVSLMAHELCNAFQSLGERVVFVGPKGSYVPPEFNRRYSAYEDLEFRKGAATGRSARSEDHRIETLFSRIIEREQLERILLIHPHHYGIGAQMAADKLGIPLSVYFHGFELRSQLKGRYPQSASEQQAEPWPVSLRDRTFSTIANAQELLTNSRYTADLLVPFPTRPLISVTGCGVAPELLKSASGDLASLRADARIRLGLSEGSPVLAFVGRIEPTKRTDRLLQIAAALPECQVLIGGSGPGEALLAGAIVSSKLGDRARVFGKVDEATKRDILAAADFACLLSEPDDASGRVEGFGIALLEGAAMGAIPVSSGTGGMGDVVVDGVNGLILPPSLPAGAAAEKLMTLHRDLEQRGRITTAARQQLLTKFNWLSIAAKMQRRWRDRLAA